MVEPTGLYGSLPNPGFTLAKAALRDHFKAIRQQLPTDLLSHQIATHLLASPRVQQAHVILSYVGFKGEIRLTPLMQALPQIVWGIPRCLKGYQLAWHRLPPEALTDPSGSPDLRQSKFGVWEPVPEVPEVDPTGADLILVPALACDPWGQRLGYGGGYYDRFCQQVQRPTLGVVPQACWVKDPLPTDPWDYRLDGVVTEQGIHSALPLSPKAR